MHLFFGELIGTLVLILLGNGVVANVLLKESKGFHGGWIVISAGWGFAVAIAVYICGWISGGHINPAVTLSLALAGKLPWKEVPLYFAGQFIGAFLGAALVYATYYTHYQISDNEEHKLLTFCTKPAIPHRGWNFVTEVIATTLLIVGVLALIDAHNGIVKGMGPFLVGILVYGIGLSLGGPTGYAINPARDLSPRLFHSCVFSFRKSNWAYAPIPFFAPCVGALLGTLLYRFLLFLPL